MRGMGLGDLSMAWSVVARSLEGGFDHPERSLLCKYAEVNAYRDPEIGTYSISL